MSDQDLRLVINGISLTNFSAVSVSMGIDQIADAFSIDADFNLSDTMQKIALKPFQYSPFQLYLGSSMLMSGTCESHGFSFSANSRSATIQGRSKTGVLVDCPILDEFQFTKMTVAEIARKVCQPYGVSVRPDADSTQIEDVTCEYGDTVANFLTQLCTSRNLFLNSSFDGKLVISNGNVFASSAPVAALSEGDGQMLSARINYDGTRRFSEYTAASQKAGCEDLKATVRDAIVKKRRPKIEKLGDIDQNPETTAKQLKGRGFAESMQLSVTVNGWTRKNGSRWAERQTIIVKAPSLYMNSASKWVIKNVNYTFSVDGGKTTALELVLPASYTGNSGSEPWS